MPFSQRGRVWDDGFVKVIHLSGSALSIALVLHFSSFLLARAEHPEEVPVNVVVENGPPEIQKMAHDIVAETAWRFQQASGVAVGKMPIHVVFVDTVDTGENIRTDSGRVQGVTIYNPETSSCTVQIPLRKSSSFGRVLAHEVTHAFVREAYGRVINRTLNEGLAEYMASLEFPSEVRHDLQRARGSGLMLVLRPYVDGQQFCQDHATDPHFGSFLASEFKTSHLTYSQLSKAWKEQFPE